MDQNGQQPERLEDQLRRMMLASTTSQTVPVDHQGYSHPTVRLPPGQQPRRTPAQPSHRAHQSHHTQTQAPYVHARPDLHNPQYVQPQQQGTQYASSTHGNGSQPNRMDHGPRNKHYHQIQSTTHQHRNFNPNTFDRGQPHAHRQPRKLFNYQASTGPSPHFDSQPNWRQMQASYLEQIAGREIPAAEMTQVEHNAKEAFRTTLQQVCSELTASQSERIPQVTLESFGSFKSGFASAGSDMDLVIVANNTELNAACFSLLEDDLPRALEKALLQKGIGARLLTRTRVPIIKVCEKPDGCLLDKLRAERERWDLLSNEKKYPHLHPEDDGDDDEGDQVAGQADDELVSTISTIDTAGQNSAKSDLLDTIGNTEALRSESDGAKQQTAAKQLAESAVDRGKDLRRRVQQDKKWARERKAGPLDFPKEGIGIQCDINFFNPLGLHNTQMLRCYSLCDPRVRPIVLFVKAWAKRRKINSSYSGTLSSYGYVMMVLHYLINIAGPPVLPNLQLWHPFMGEYTPGQKAVEVDGWNVSFFGNEQAIINAAQNGLITANRQPVGTLLAGFFHYYSALGGGGASFHWMQNVVSLRTEGGLMSKEQKGWVKATTEEGGGKRVQHRYLFCIEDPFELNHNIARTVTHHGIVAIRDELRRAHRILIDAGNGRPLRDGELFDRVEEVNEETQTGWGPKEAVEWAANENMSQPSADRNQAGHRMQHNTQHRGDISGTRLTEPVVKSLDVMDCEAFPALGGARPKGRGKQSNFSTISGQQAKAHLEEVKRKKAEQLAEDTAKGAAESVLQEAD